MNIMLVSSPSARARSASARRSAPGASDILTQFLTEAVLVSLIGGLAGVAVGVIGSQFEIAGVHPEIATYSIFLAFGAAARLGPVLRHLSRGPRRPPQTDRGAAL